MNQTIIGGRYKVLKKLSKGGFGETFIAEDINSPNQQLFVIKKLKPESSNPVTIQLARRLFKQETQVLYHLGKHPQIPSMLANIEENGEFYLVQEYIEGKTLQQEINERKNFDEVEVVATLMQLLEVLSYVHRQNVIHRDIKPSNIIRRKDDGRIVLIDFGAVKQVRNQISVDANGYSTSTVAIGSSGYMATEQLAGHPRYSSDVYSVGMLAIQLLTKLHPMQLQQSQQTGEWVWLNRVSIHLEFAKIIKKMVFYDYRQRYDSAITVLNELKRLKLYYSGAKRELWNTQHIKHNAKIDVGHTQVTFAEPIPSYEESLDATQQYDSPPTKVEFASKVFPNHLNQGKESVELKALNASRGDKKFAVTGSSGSKAVNYFFVISTFMLIASFIGAVGVILVKHSRKRFNEAEKTQQASNEYKPNIDLLNVKNDKVKLEVKKVDIPNKPFVEKYKKTEKENTSQTPKAKNVPKSNTYPSFSPWDHWGKAKELKSATLVKERYAISTRDWLDIISDWNQVSYSFSTIKMDDPNFNQAQKEKVFCQKKIKAAHGEFQKITKELRSGNNGEVKEQSVEKYLDIDKKN